MDRNAVTLALSKAAAHEHLTHANYRGKCLERVVWIFTTLINTFDTNQQTENV
jgi:hypothetical protein